MHYVIPFNYAFEIMANGIIMHFAKAGLVKYNSAADPYIKNYQVITLPPAIMLGKLPREAE